MLPRLPHVLEACTEHAMPWLPGEQRPLQGARHTLHGVLCSRSGHTCLSFLSSLLVEHLPQALCYHVESMSDEFHLAVY